MNDRQRNALELCGTNIEEVLHRMCGNEKLYTECLSAFLDDTTVGQMNAAIESESWDDAYIAAHALKGVAGNMGFSQLMSCASQLSTCIRQRQIQEIPALLKLVNSSYREIIDGVQQYFAFADEQSQSA